MRPILRPGQRGSAARAGRAKQGWPAATIAADGPARMVKRPSGSGGEPSSPNCGLSAGARLVNQMKITFCCTETQAGPWFQGLAAALPRADISLWQPGAPQAGHAVVWKPPQQVIDEQPRRRTLFNLGAGGDALLRLRLPPAALVVRLDDAGMGGATGENVWPAVVCHLRQV